MFKFTLKCMLVNNVYIDKIYAMFKRSITVKQLFRDTTNNEIENTFFILETGLNNKY